MVDSITQEGMRAHLSKDINTSLSIEILESTTSTNDYVKRAKPINDTLYRAVIADTQTRGKGRRGKVFASPAGTGIYLSIHITKPDLLSWFAQKKTPKKSDQSNLSGEHKHFNSFAWQVQSLTALAALAVCRAIEETTEKRAYIKWPNDVYCDGKKVCGILCESQIEAYTGTFVAYIAGIGINVYPSVELSQKDQNGGYLVENVESGLRNKLSASVIREFVSLLEQGTEEAWEEYRQRSMLIGRSILVEYDDSRSVPAQVQDINENFQLIVSYKDGTSDTLDVGNFSIIF